jgi:hypothetical protein
MRRRVVCTDICGCERGACGCVDVWYVRICVDVRAYAVGCEVWVGGIATGGEVWSVAQATSCATIRTPSSNRTHLLCHRLTGYQDDAAMTGLNVDDMGGLRMGNYIQNPGLLSPLGGGARGHGRVNEDPRGPTGYAPGTLLLSL